MAYLPGPYRTGRARPALLSPLASALFTTGFLGEDVAAPPTFTPTCQTCGLPLVLVEGQVDPTLYVCLNGHYWRDVDASTGFAWMPVEPPAVAEAVLEPWLPQNMAGLLGLYLPDTLQFTHAHGQNVLTWPDSGGLGNHADGTIQSFQGAPTWDASQGAVRFLDPGASPWPRLDSPVPSDTDGQAFVMTFKAASEKNMYLLSGTGSGVTRRRVRLLAGATDDARLYREATLLYDTPGIPGVLWNFDVPFILSGYITANSYMFGVNGSYVTGSHAVATTNEGGITRIGKSGNNSETADGWMYALAFFDNPLYLVDLQAMEGWMAHTFGVPLDPSHPYAAAPPMKTATGVARLDGITL